MARISLLLLLIILTTTLYTVVQSVDRSQWVEPNELRTKSKKKTNTRKNADKLREELMTDEEEDTRTGNNFVQYTTDADVLELLDKQRDELTSQYTAKFTPVRRMVSGFLTSLSRAGSTFSKKKGSDAHVERFDAAIKLESDDYKMLKRVAENSDPTVGQVQDAMEVLNEMIVQLELTSSDEEPTWSGELLAQILNPQEKLLIQYLLLGNVALLMLLMAILVYHTMQLDKWQFFWRLLLVVFMASCVWTWLHMYKEKQAEMQARWAKRNIPAACQQQAEISAPMALYNYVISTVKLPEADECTEYHKDLLIDPIYMVPPTMAFSRTCTAFLLEPLQHIAHHLGLFIQHLFKDLPVTYYPLAIVFTIILVVIPLFCYAGYCLRLPFGVYLGPSAPPSALPIHPIAPIQPISPPNATAIAASPPTPPAPMSITNRSNSATSNHRSRPRAAPIKLYIDDGSNNKNKRFIRLKQAVDSTENDEEEQSSCESRSRSLSVGRKPSEKKKE